MILENAIKNKISKIKAEDKLLIQNLLKEELQNFVLNFIYTSKYKRLIFTGGTCLRKNYGLNRLSEDLDFDYIEKFDIDKFTSDVVDYFRKFLKYNSISARISGNRMSVFLKFPILREQVFSMIFGKKEDLFLRCDFSKEITGVYATETNLITAGQYEFFTLSYDLPTLFANKIVATLERVYFKGKYQKVPSKGRDIYDLYWLLQLSGRTGFSLKPNKERMFKLLDNSNIDEIKNLLKKKVEMVEENYLYQDILPLLESKELLVSFKKNFKANIISKLDFVM